MNALVITILLLIVSNAFMAFAWYGHLKDFATSPVAVVIIISWGIAFLEYIFLIPANRIGFSQANLSLEQLKILQEVITLVVFVPFAIFYMEQKISWDYVWAGLCMVGAVYFIFR